MNKKATRTRITLIFLSFIFALCALATFLLFDNKKVYADSLFSVGGNSTVNYGTYDTAQHGGNTGSVTGLQVKLAKGDTFRVNEVIDISKNTSSDSIIGVTITPEKIGQPDFLELNVRLTDAYNSDIFIEYQITHYKREVTQETKSLNHSYQKVRYNGSDFIGIEPQGTGPVIYRNSMYGTHTGVDFYGMCHYTANGQITNNTAYFAYNYKTQECTNPYTRFGANYICNFSNVEEFAEPFVGFTTGEVFLSITTDAVTTDCANFTISSLQGITLSSQSFSRTKEPEMKIDTDGETTAPNGVVGRSYPLFNATGFSVYDGVISPEVKVYKNYNTTREEVLVENNSFTPQSAGNYTIIYSLKDTSGLKDDDVRYDITVLSQPNPLNVEFVGEYDTESVAGYLIALPDVSAQGGHGNLEVEYVVEFEGNAEIVEKTFRPTKAGTYVIKAYAIDYLGYRECDNAVYTLNVSAGNSPVFTERIIMPRFFVNNGKFELPSQKAFNFTDGSGSSVPVSITYVDDYGTHNAINNVISPKVKTNGKSVKVIYSANLNGNYTKDEYEIPCFAPFDEYQTLHIENLFSLDGTFVFAKEESIDFTAYNNGSSFEFINSLLVKNYEAVFKINENYRNFSSVTIILTDEKDMDVSVWVTVKKTASGYIFYLNNDQSNSITVGNSFFGSNITLHLSDDNSVYFNADNINKIKIKKTYNGQEFAGFSGAVFTKFVFNGVVDVSEISLLSLGGMNMNNSDTDRVSPLIFPLDDYGGKSYINTEYKLPRILVKDVIDPTVTVTVTVTDPDGKNVMSTNSIELKDVPYSDDIRFMLSQFGRYTVTYTAKDSSGRPASFSYYVRIFDTEAPVITANAKPKAEYKIGEKIYVPTATAVDAIDGEVKVYRFVDRPDGVTTYIENSFDSFTTDVKGTYFIRLYCYDLSGNVATQTFVVAVTD